MNHPIDSTAHNEQAWTEEDAAESEQPLVVPADPPRGTPETITLSQHMLGLEPYLLIRVFTKPEAEREDDDGFRLRVESGGGAQGPDLGALYLLNVPAAQNPLTAAIKDMIQANPDAPQVREVLAAFADHCDIPMPELA